MNPRSPTSPGADYKCTADKRLVLSIFPGIDLLGCAFEEQGFCVVRGPDVLWGGDIRRFDPPSNTFYGIIAGPPCQEFSRLAHMVRHNGLQPRFGNLIPEFERCVLAAQPQWFVMEEVPDAPAPVVNGYGHHTFLLNNRQLGERQNRLRRWTFGWLGGRRSLHVETVVFEHPEFEYAACGVGRAVPVRLGGSGEVKRTRRLPGTHRSRANFAALCKAQGLAEIFDLPGCTVAAKCNAVSNGVPLAMGRAIAKAVTKTIGDT